MDGEQDDDYKKVKKTANEQTTDKYGDDANNFSLADNENMKNGMCRDRKMTDILMLIIFMAFIGAMGFCTVYGINHGKTKKLTAPLDGSDNFCGITPGFEGYDNLYLTDLNSISAVGIFSKGVCVKACPVKAGDAIVAKPNTVVTDVSTLKAAYPTKEVVGYCFPSSTDAVPDGMKAGWKAAKASFLSNPVGAYFNDMYLSSRAIYASFGMGVVYCFVYIYLMSLFAETIAWICVGVAQLGFILLSVGCWFMRAAEAEKAD